MAATSSLTWERRPNTNLATDPQHAPPSLTA